MAQLKTRAAERLQQRLQDPRARAQSLIGSISEQDKQRTVDYSEGIARLFQQATAKCAVRGVRERPKAAAAVSEIPVLKQRVAPGRTTATPPKLSGSTLAAPRAAQAELGATRRLSADLRDKTPPRNGVRRTSPVSVASARDKTPPPSSRGKTPPPSSRPASGSRDKTPPPSGRTATVSRASALGVAHPASTSRTVSQPRPIQRRVTVDGTPSATHLQAAARCPKAQAAPPPERFAPPLRRASSAALLGKPSAKAAAASANIINTAIALKNGSARRNSGESASSSALPGSAQNQGQGEKKAIPLLEQILQENRELRGAFTQATQRIAALEEGQQSFFDERIFDLVNAAHAAPPQTECEFMQLDIDDSDVQPVFEMSTDMSPDGGFHLSHCSQSDSECPG